MHRPRLLLRLASAASSRSFLPSLAIGALCLGAFACPAPEEPAADAPASADGGTGAEPDGAADDGPPGPEVLQPIQAEVDDGLSRSYQDVDVTLTVPAAPLRLELWSDGTTAEDAGNALSVLVRADGSLSFELRFGKEIIPIDSARVTLPADRGLRLRLRRREDGAGLLYLDVRKDGAWSQQAPVLQVDSTRAFQGRRVLLVEKPAGAAAPVIEPQAPPGAFSFNRAFDRVADWKLYQRGDGGRADLPLSFTYRAAAPAILTVEVLRAADQAPLAGFSAQRFALPPSPGRSARAVLRAVPAGGNYLLRARMSDAGAMTALGEDTLKELAVGDVFLAIGQSNMSGFAPLSPPEAPTDAVHLFGNDYVWKRATEPMDGGEDQVDRVSEENAEHSLMLRFGKELARATSVPVAIIPGPRYGTSIEAWARMGGGGSGAALSRGTFYGSAVHRVRLHGYGAPIRGVLWYQGEGNAGSGIDNYLNQLGILVANLREDLGGRPFLGLCQLATNGDVIGEQALSEYQQPQEALRRYPAQDAQSAVVALLDLPRSDPYHLSNAGIKEAGARLARAVLAKGYGLPQTLGPALRGAVLGSAGDSVELTYDKPMGGGDAALFRVSDGGGAPGVASVTVSGVKVVVKLRRKAQGAVLLSYGYSNNPAARWLVGADGSGGALAFQELRVP